MQLLEWLLYQDRVLTPDEKSFLLCVERGDTATARSTAKALTKRPQVRNTKTKLIEIIFCFPRYST